MKKKIIYIVLIIIALIVALIFLLRKPKIVMEKKFKPTIEVINGTDYDVDTTLLTIADKIMELDTLTIRVYYSTITMEKDGIIVNNFAVKNILPHDYTINIGRNANAGLIRKVLAHEMVHIKQYEKGDLIEVEKGKILEYKGKTIDLLNSDYKRRPYEIDAFREQMHVLSMLNRITYE